MHLTPDELIDVAEGTRRGSSLPHLASCEMCRTQVAQLRAVISSVASVAVPEPSPLFWDQFSVRVRDAIAANPSGSGWRWMWSRFRTPLVLAATPAVVILCVLSARLITRPAPPPSAASLASTADFQGGGPFADDPSFQIVADLTGPIDLDTAKEAGLAKPGSAEHAVTHLSKGELRALRQLLKQELAN